MSHYTPSIYNNYTPSIYNILHIKLESLPPRSSREKLHCRKIFGKRFVTEWSFCKVKVKAHSYSQTSYLLLIQWNFTGLNSVSDAYLGII